MKTSRLLLLAGLLAGTASLLTAGPGPQFWSRPVAPQPAPATITPAAVAATTDIPTAPMAAVCSTCACCKKA